MRGQITEVFTEAVGGMEGGLSLIERMIVAHCLDNNLDDRKEKIRALKEATEWLEDTSMLLCRASEKAMGIEQPSGELLTAVEKTLQIGAAMLAIAERFLQKVKSAEKNDWEEIKVTLNDVTYVLTQFELLRVVLLNVGENVPRRRVEWRQK